MDKNVFVIVIRNHELDKLFGIMQLMTYVIAYNLLACNVFLSSYLLSSRADFFV